MSIDSDTRVKQRYDVMESVHRIVAQVFLLCIARIPQHDTNCVKCKSLIKRV